MTIMTSSQEELLPLADIDQIIHAPARLMVLIYLYVVDSADYVFLTRLTGLTWGNLSAHLAKLEEAGYVRLEKGYRGKRPHTVVMMTDSGRKAFRTYKQQMEEALRDLPD